MTVSAVRYLPGALCVGMGWGEAAHALSALSSRAQEILEDEATLTTLAQACDDAARSGMPVEHRSTAVRALSHVASGLSLAQAQAFLERLMVFPVQRLQGMVMMGLQDTGAAEEIAVMASALRGVDLDEEVPEGGTHPVQVLFGALIII